MMHLFNQLNWGNYHSQNCYIMYIYIEKKRKKKKAHELLLGLVDS